MPKVDDICLDGLDYEIKPGHKFTKEDLQTILTINNQWWLEAIENIHAFYEKIGKTVPEELRNELTAMENRLKA